MAAAGPRARDYLDLSATIAVSIFDPEGYPWLALSRIASFVEALLAAPPPGYRRVADKVIAAEGASISPRAELLGPAVIGPNSEIRTGAFIRENVVIGAFCVVGNSTELKNSILFDLAQAPHFNYVGDSIMGRKSHVGAGVILSNFKFDGSEISVHAGGGHDLPTGLVKFGAVLGDHVEIGCNSVCYPGTLVGRGAAAYPLSALRGIVPPNSLVKPDGVIAPKRLCL